MCTGTICTLSNRKDNNKIRLRIIFDRSSLKTLPILFYYTLPEFKGLWEQYVHKLVYSGPRRQKVVLLLESKKNKTKQIQILLYPKLVGSLHYQGKGPQEGQKIRTSSPWS